MAKSKKPARSKRARKLPKEAVESGDILEQETINKLLHSVPEEGVDDGSRVIPYDFRHPAQVSRTQLRMIENLHANLARRMSATFSSLQRSIVDVDIAFVDQTTYGEFLQTVANPGITYNFGMRPLGGQAIIDIAPDVTYDFIERIFSSKRMNRPEGRPMTGVERGVMGRVITRMLEDLEGVWKPLVEVEILDAELETNAEFMQTAAPGDTVILIAFEVNAQHASGLITLVYPYFTLEPVLALFKTRILPSTREDTGVSARQRQQRLDLLQAVDTDVTVTWGRGTFSVNDIAGLREGDTLVLDTDVNDPATVWLEDRPLFHARPGVSGGHLAVQLVRALSEMDGSTP